MGLTDALKNLFSGSSKKQSKKKRPETIDPAVLKKKIAKTKKSAPAKDGDITLTAKPKGRRKSEQVKSDPIDEAALGFSISLKNEQAHKRHSLRIRVDDLKVFVPRLKKSFEVVDISPGGLGFKFEKPRIKAGVKIKMDIVLKGKKEAEGVVVKVRRHERGQVGCAFVDLDRAQDDAVHRIVLLGQKQQAARKAAQRDEEFKPPA